MKLLFIVATSHILSFSSFMELDIKRQEAYIYQVSDLRPSVEINIRDKKLPNLNSKKLDSYIKNTSILAYSLYFEPDYYSAVGDFELDYSIVLSKENEIIGSNIRVFQKGCAHKDEEQSNIYESTKEAIADGCDVDADVSWTAYLYLDRHGKIISRYSDDYFQWTGW